MSSTVYILGAGFNKELKIVHKKIPQLNLMTEYVDSPPVLNDVFQAYLKSFRYNESQKGHGEYKCLFDYMKEKYHKDLVYLKKSPFEVEKLYSDIHEKLVNPNETNPPDLDEVRKLQCVFYKITQMLSQLLEPFEMGVFPEWDGHTLKISPYDLFAKNVLLERATVITFNYDLILERLLQSASHLSDGYNGTLVHKFLHGEEYPPELLEYSRSNWNNALAYGMKLDEVEPNWAGAFRPVKGDVFYNLPKNKLYDWPILKLHGSFNWCRYITGARRHAGTGEILPEEKVGEIMLHDAHVDSWQDTKDGWPIFPVLISAFKDKDIFYKEKPFPFLWKKAEDVLKQAKELTIIGFKFAKEDYKAIELVKKISNLKKLTVVCHTEETYKRIISLIHSDMPPVYFKSFSSYVKENISEDIQIPWNISFS